MALIDILKKLNIIRVGSVSGTYHNAKERPMALQDDMFLGKSEPGSAKNDKAPKGTLFGVLIISVILAILFILLALTSTISWLIILIWVVWVVYVWLLFAGKITFVLGLTWMVVLIILSVVSAVLVIFTQTDNNSSTVSNAPALTTAECKPYYEKYNNKVLNISSDGLQGTIGIKIDNSNGCKLHGYYNVILSQNLPQNPYKRDIGVSYHYNILLREADRTTRTKYDEFGVLSPAFKNTTLLPDPFANSLTRTNLYSQGMDVTETRYFYWGYEIDTNFSEARYQEILDDTKLEIINGTPFIEETKDSNGYSYTVNGERAAISAEIVKTYNLTIEES